LSLIEKFVPEAAAKTEQWIREMRDRHLKTARGLTTAEREKLQKHFDAELLNLARVEEVRELQKPPFFDGLRSQLAFVGMRIAFDFATASGLTFDNCLLLRQSAMSDELLFHEMVHAEQYRQLGVARFAAAYVRGFADGGFTHEGIPLEHNAIALTARFGAKKEFSVREEVGSWLATRNY
jgi:hypothetical protein